MDGTEKKAKPENVLVAKQNDINWDKNHMLHSEAKKKEWFKNTDKIRADSL